MGRIVSLLQTTGKLRAGSFTIGTSGKAYRLTFGSDIKFISDPRNFHFVPADELAIAGKDYTNRVRTDGIGAPVLVETEAPLEKARELFLVSEQLFYGMTAVLEFQGQETHLLMKIHWPPTA